MDAITEKISKRLEVLVREIKENLANKKINATGKTSASFMVDVYEGGVRVISAEGEKAPISTLEIGHNGGNVPNGFYGIILKWSRDKKITFPSERERRTFAYFASRKIEKEGTERYYNNVDVYSSAVKRCAEDIKSIVNAEVKEIIKINF